MYPRYLVDDIYRSKVKQCRQKDIDTCCDDQSYHKWSDTNKDILHQFAFFKFIQHVRNNDDHDDAWCYQRQGHRDRSYQSMRDVSDIRRHIDAHRSWCRFADRDHRR